MAILVHFLSNKYVNKKLNSSNSIAPPHDANGNLPTDNAEKAELLNKYFSSVFTTDNGIMNSSALRDQSPPYFFQLFVLLLKWS